MYRPRKLWDYLGVFEAILDEGIAQGVIRADVDPFTTKWAFFGSLDELGLQWAVSRKRRLDLQAAAVSVAEVFIRGVGCPGRCAPRPGVMGLSPPPLESLPAPIMGNIPPTMRPSWRNRESRRPSQAGPRLRHPHQDQRRRQRHRHG
ncbi:MAG: hypothetical protein H6740_05395 [Alphaproteobacteria bacterium]|nr:hypothetical protein [Alphaproteobacteria bacterium]